MALQLTANKREIKDFPKLLSANSAIRNVMRNVSFLGSNMKVVVIVPQKKFNKEFNTVIKIKGKLKIEKLEV